MTNEQLRMQMLSGIITEGEYKAKLQELGGGMSPKRIFRRAVVQKLNKIYNSVDNEELKQKLMDTFNPTIDGIVDNRYGDDIGRYPMEDLLDDLNDYLREITQGMINQYSSNDSLNESMIGGIVGVGAINQIPSRAKTDYEMAFEHFLGERYEVKPNRERDDIKDLEEGEDGKHLYGNKYVTSAGGKVEKNTTPPSRQDMEAAAAMARNLGSDTDAYSSLFDKYDGYGPNMESELEENNPLTGGAGFMSKQEIFKLTKLIAGAELELARQGDSMTPESIAKAEETISGLRAARERAIEKYKEELKDNYSGMREGEEKALEEGDDDLFTAKRFYKRTDNPRINILSHMGTINDIVMDMLETDLVKGYGPDERDDIYREYMKFVNAVQNLVK